MPKEKGIVGELPTPEKILVNQIESILSKTTDKEVKKMFEYIVKAKKDCGFEVDDEELLYMWSHSEDVEEWDEYCQQNSPAFFRLWECVEKEYRKQLWECGKNFTFDPGKINGGVASGTWVVTRDGRQWRVRLPSYSYGDKKGPYLPADRVFLAGPGGRGGSTSPFEDIRILSIQQPSKHGTSS